MASYATFPALIATFQADWGLSNTGAGWISGSYFAGVAIGTLVLASLTDRWSGKRVYLPSMALAAIAALGFALLADGLWSASFWRFLQGVALGGTYLPGLRALLQSIPRPQHGRATALYTGAFYVGASLSFFLAGVLESRFGWADTFLWSAVGPILARCRLRSTRSGASTTIGRLQAGESARAARQSPGPRLHTRLYSP